MVQDQSIDPAGNVYFSWAGYEQNGGAKGAVNLFISKSAVAAAPGQIKSSTFQARHAP